MRWISFAVLALLLAPVALASQTTTARYVVVAVQEDGCGTLCGGVGAYIGAAASPGDLVTLRVADDAKAMVGAGYAFYGPGTTGPQPRTPFCDGEETVVVPSWADRVVLEVQTAQEATSPGLNFCGTGMEGTTGTMSIVVG